MKHASHLLILLLSLSMGPLYAQFSTPTQNGVITAGEYGTHTNGQNQQADGGTIYYMAWDANNLYVAYAGTNYNEAAVLYLDIDPVIPVNGGTNANGSIQGYYTYERNHMMQPFRADFALYYKNGYHEYRLDDGAGYWGAAVSNTLAVGTNAGSNTVEIAIPWNTITGGGRPAQFNWFTYKVYDYGPGINGIYNALPLGNPNCACNQDPSRTYATHYYNVLNTSNGTSTKPFAVTSFTYHQDNSGAGTGGYYLNGGAFYDFTVNDNSTNNTDNDPAFHLYDNNEISNRVLVEGTITISHHLYVGQGSALLPANNNPNPVIATLVFTGSNGGIYNHGRIDPNPEALNAGDWNNRKMDFVFAGSTRLMPSNVFKDRWRMSNVTVNAGGSLLGPLVDSTSIEVQWGTFTNLGVVDLGDGTAGFADLGTRGDWSQHNDYFLTGAGTWRMHQVLIGRNSSRLQPANGGTPVRLLVQGDFENYDDFLGKNGTGRIDVVMAGKRRQYLKGNTTETTGATTSFYNLEIDNANGLGDNNNSADVYIQSYGGGTIDYFVTGQLKITNGDLVTRDRVTSTVHHLTLRDSATVDFAGAKSNLGLAGSSFVDGPLRWEIETASPVTREFPVGKTKAVTGFQIGDYRHVQLEVDLDAATTTTFVAEMYLDDRSGFYTWPSPVPEAIAWISQQRYWNISHLSGANVQAAFVTLSYDQVERTDGVINAPALRMVKDDGAGNWVNITPLGPGGSANGAGTMHSHAFTAFSDFTLASIDPGQPLPATLLSFDASLEHGMVRLYWRTSHEVNSDVFVLEASSNRSQFHEVGRVDAAGRSDQPLDYQFWDSHPELSQPFLYYRVKVIDLDGSATYSEVRAIKVSEDNTPRMFLYPNPSSGDVRLEIVGGNDVVMNELEVHDMVGKRIWAGAWEDGLRCKRLDLARLPKGTYTVTLSTDGEMLRAKMVIQ